MSDRSPFYTPFYPGGFAPQKPPRAKSLEETQTHLQTGQPFAVRPGGDRKSVV